MADGTVVFATELDMSGVKTALSNFGKSKTTVPAIHVPTEVGEKDFLASLDKIGYKAGQLLGNGIKLGIAAVGAISTGAITLITKSLGSTKELEQNLGGSEAVFADYAKTVQKTGQKAFKYLGLSQSDYLATANQMGSLFKGLGYDAEEAADVTMEAMQRAADVASIMGIDTTWAMESIAGAAKGNFTMMDNLGVAINDTTLANYALTKGISKSVSKMSTQEKVALALEMFMENTAYAAGQYAKENDTLAGSLTTLGAAWDNFLAGTGESSVDDLVGAISNSIDVLTLKLQELMPRLAEELPAMITKLTPVLSELLKTVLPSLTEMVVALIPPIATALGEAAKALAPALLQGLLSGIVGDETAVKIMDFLKRIFNPEIATGEGVEQTAVDQAMQNAMLQEQDFLMQQYQAQQEAMKAAMAEEAASGGLWDRIVSFFGGGEENTEQTKAVGRKMVEDIGAGIDEAAAEAETRAAELGQRIRRAAVGEGERTRPEGTGTEAVAAEGEGEGEANPLAMQILQSVAMGIDANASLVKTALQTALSNAEAGADVSGFNGVGLQISNGIAAGIRSGTGAVVAAVQAVIAAALAAAEKAADINSPSRLFRDRIGASLSEGVAKGVENDAYLVRRAVNEMVFDSMPNMRSIGSRAASMMSTALDDGSVATASRYGAFNQTNNFNVPVQTPDEFANTMHMYATYGLAAEG